VSLADDLRAQADAAEQQDRLADAYAAALAAYRENPNDDTRAAYKDAAEALATHRRDTRIATGRPGEAHTLAGDVFLSPDQPEG
jgi:hypothetical protein